MNGFTLMEILIAFFIFVIIMGIVVTGISISVTAEEHISVKTERLAEIQLAMAVISSDFEQISLRPVIDNYGDILEPVEYDTENLDVIEFTRSGLINPMMLEPRSTLQRVAYHFENNQLIRKSWPVLDRTINTRTSQRVLLDNILAFSIQPKEDATDRDITLGLIITITTEKFGTISRIYATPTNLNEV